jgi:hypothetical protein
MRDNRAHLFLRQRGFLDGLEEVVMDFALLDEVRFVRARNQLAEILPPRLKWPTVVRSNDFRLKERVYKELAQPQCSFSLRPLRMELSRQPTFCPEGVRHCPIEGSFPFLESVKRGVELSGTGCDVQLMCGDRSDVSELFRQGTRTTLGDAAQADSPIRMRDFDCGPHETVGSGDIGDLGD